MMTEQEYHQHVIKELDDLSDEEMYIFHSFLSPAKVAELASFYPRMDSINFDLCLNRVKAMSKRARESVNGKTHGRST